MNKHDTMDMNSEAYPLLSLIDSPDELRLISKEALPQLCDELRRYLLSCVSVSSGHLASGLGVIELTVALHYVYQTPFDNLIWDVGHQAYPHKILTGRRQQITSIRQKDGLHPFPWRLESPYDVLSVGHSSTSISAGLGMAIAATKEGKQRKTVSVIGDGSITAGMAFEAMNHAGSTKSDFLVILNDNNMSISKNVGALNHHLARLISGQTYTQLRTEGKKIVEHIPPLKGFLKYTEEQLKGLMAPRTLFEGFGFNYIGPLEGHDVIFLVEMLQNMRQLSGPQFLHVQTKKGKGYAPAEQDPIRWHGVPCFDPKQGHLPETSQQPPSYSNIFGDWLCEIAAKDPKLVAITPAMAEGSGMTEFAKRYPEQFIDVAIAEQHAVTLAAGLAIAGYHPVVAIYSTFLQRAYDQLIHDVALQELPVLFAIDRAGIVGADGATHQGAFDLSFLRCIPNMIIMTPSSAQECRNMLYTGYQYDGLCAVRYPKATTTTCISTNLIRLPIGKAQLKFLGHSGIALLNFGNLLHHVLTLCQENNITLVDMRFVKPLDDTLLKELTLTHHHFVTLEENVITGGAGSAVCEWSMQQNTPIKVTTLGFPDNFIPQGSIQEIHQMLGLDHAGIAKTLATIINNTSL